MKKIVSLTAAALLIFTMVFGMFTVSAADESVKVSVGTVKLDKTEMVANGGYYTVSVPISITENTGFVSIRLDVEYDEKLELVGWTEGEVFPPDPNEEGVSGTEGLPALGNYSPYNGTSPRTEDFENNPFRIYYVADKEPNNTSVGKLITLDFKVPENVAVGEYPITATVIEALSQNGSVDNPSAEEVPLPEAITSACTATAGKIKVVDSFNIVAKSETAMLKDGYVEVDIDLENNPGIKKLGFAVEFDAQSLEFEGATSYGIFAEDDFEAITADNGVLYVYAEADALATESGKLVTLKFKLADTVSAGDYSITPVFKGDPRDGASDGVDEVFVDNSTPGTVTVKTVIYGDADGNGRVTLNDAARIQQYCAYWEVSIDLANADADGNGRVTLNDAARIQQYCAYWDVQLGN